MSICLRTFSHLRSKVKTQALSVTYRNLKAVPRDVPYESSFHKQEKKSVSSTEVPEEADVVVIGGGSVGCSAIYHLSKLLGKSVVLLERNKLTSGTTWHTAGNIKPDISIKNLLKTSNACFTLRGIVRRYRETEIR